MNLFNQPFDGQLADQLNQLLDSGKYCVLNIAVAFAKKGGIKLLRDAICRFRKQGGVVNAYIGIDLQGTSSDALEELLSLVDLLYVVHTSTQTFHPKIYQFVNGIEFTVVVGSNNLTVGGLWRNFESSIIITGASTDGKTGLGKECEQYFNQLTHLQKSCRSIASNKDIEGLLKDGLITRESDRKQVARSQMGIGTSAGMRDEGFGKGYPTPWLSLGYSDSDRMPKATSPAHLKPAGETIASEFAPDASDLSFWFETRRLTGGSRNQIDLSMKSFVKNGNPIGTEFDRGKPGYMCGFVELFGVDPHDISSTLEITILFQGTDYSGNIIHFPDSKKANGTWRLLFKGTSAKGAKLTDSFRSNDDNENCLVNKILEFSRIGEKYYQLDVFPMSMHQAFEDDSSIVAYNGSVQTARLFGILS